MEKKEEEIDPTIVHMSECIVCGYRDAPGARQMPVILLLKSRLYK